MILAYFLFFINEIYYYTVLELYILPILLYIIPINLNLEIQKFNQICYNLFICKKNVILILGGTMETYESSANLKQKSSEIELRDLITILWNHKIMVLILTLIFAVGAAVFSVYFISPTYETTFTIALNVPEAYNTKYGDFESPIKNNIDYINLIKSNEVIEKTILDMGYNLGEVSVESISNRVVIGKIDKDQNVIPITVTGNDPHEIVEISNKLYKNYEENVDLIIKDRAINHFYKDYTVKLETSNDKLQSTNELLAKQEELINTTPKLIDQEALLKTLSESSDYIILDDIINPNYTNLENTIVETKKTIGSLQNNIATYETYIEELSLEKESLNKFYEAGGQGKFESDVLDTSDVFVLSQAMVPSDKLGPNITMNVVIAGVVGSILSLFIVFFKAYLKKEI